MLPTILGRWSLCCFIVWLCGLYYEAFCVEPNLAPRSHLVFHSPVYHCDHFATGRDSWSISFLSICLVYFVYRVSITCCIFHSE